MPNKETLQNDLKEAIRSGDKIRRATLRMVLSAIKLAEVEKQRELDEIDLLSIFQKEVKSRHETIADAERAGRPELISDLESELSILESYMPEPLSEEEIKKIAMDIIEETNAQGPQDMGKVMKNLMPRIQNRSDGSTVSGIVRSLLTKE